MVLSFLGIMDGPVVYLFYILAAAGIVISIVKRYNLKKSRSSALPPLPIAPPAPNSRVFQFSRNGMPVGAYPEGAIKALIAQGRIKKEDDYWAQGMLEWKKVSSNSAWY